MFTKYFAWLKHTLIGVTVALSSLVLCPSAYGVPSYARQTGLTCNVCHSHPPELTAFGRKFKLNAYTLTELKPDARIESMEPTELKINKNLPISAMVVVDNTILQSHVPGTQNGNAQFPQILSVFLAGAFAPHFGGQVQVTYSHQSDHFSLDNTDLRYANHTTLRSKDLLYGFTLNNSPTTEDVWNSTPSWGYPFVSPNNTPSPIAKPVILGALAQDVAGVGAYTMWNDHLYASATLYRSEHIGGAQPATGNGYTYNIRGAAPYWRLAWQQNWGRNYLEAGTYGIYVSSIPGAITGKRDTYLDPSVDFQYERPVGLSLITMHGSYTHELSDLQSTFAAGGAATASHHLNTIRADANYHFRSHVRGTLGGFSTTGPADLLLYAPAPITGSASGSPNSSGVISQIAFWPKQNIEFSAQYTAYTKFNGASRNYDGAGRNASANNATYLSIWFSY